MMTAKRNRFLSILTTLIVSNSEVADFCAG